MRNKEELVSYIASFNKEPGQYTLEETLNIGVAMRTLPKNLISWPWLRDYLGITDCTSEAYRARVSKYIKQNNISIGKEIISNDVIKEAFASKLQGREWYNAYRRLVREETRIDDLKDEIKLVVSKLNALPKFSPMPIEIGKESRIGVLLLSDLHIGVECNNFYNEYNNDIAWQRLQSLAKSVIDYVSMNKVKELQILNLGDSIHGIIHLNARIEQLMDVIEQVMTAAEYIARFLTILNSLSIPITYRSVYDNHSRVIADKNQHIEKEQFSRLIDWYLEERLKDNKIIFAKDNIDGGIGKIKIFNKTMMFAHGHQDGKKSSVQNFISLTKEWVDYICLAHYHSPAVNDFQGCKLFINGSIVGTEQYAFGKRLFSKPSQKLLIFNENRDDVLDIDIAL